MLARVYALVQTSCLLWIGGLGRLSAQALHTYASIMTHLHLPMPMSVPVVNTSNVSLNHVFAPLKYAGIAICIHSRASATHAVIQQHVTSSSC